MPLLILLSMLLTPVFAADVTTLDSHKTEILLVTTEDTLQSAIEKNYMAHVCRPRISINGTLKEFYFPSSSCRAEITKFLINNGYKPDQYFRTFVK